MKLILLLALFGFCQVISAEKIINCYWGTWANYRLDDGKFEPSNIDANLCTHLSYSFFGIEESGEIKSLDEWLDLDSGLGFISKAMALKRVNPKLKVLAVVGGWNEGSEKYSAMAADPAKRARFISTTLSLIQQHGFDGLDLDWEYPAQRGGSPADRVNFVTLLTEIRRAFAPLGLELGIAVGAGANIASVAYDIPAISKQLDFINVMTYDFHMAFDGYLGFNAPLPEVEDSINYWLQQGAPAEKLILGIGSYGHSYTMANPSQNKPGATSIGVGEPGPYTKDGGFLGYNEICLNNWQTVFDEAQGVPYAFQGNQWIGYDNVRSVELKMNLMKRKNLGGAMVWSIETDDFRGKCGESWPLLKTINRSISNDVDVSPPSTGGNGNAGRDCSSDGYYLNSNDCSRYFQCSQGTRYDFQCGNGLYFDAKSNACNWPEQVDCTAY